MCGIAGFIHFEQSRQASSETLKKMTDCIAYRGPDGEGAYLEQQLALGHRRLSIIDLSTGDQPMFSEDGKLAVVFNGEIYNYIELKAELQAAGYQFRTHSDTEVILKGWEHWGPDCQKKFNGMWAFALWDGRRKELFISRDRIGEKPVIWTEYDQTLLFGSEIKCLFAYGVPRQKDESLLEIYLTLGYIPAPLTYFRNIKKLQPGHYLHVTNGQVREIAYWTLPKHDEQAMLTDENKVYEQFEYLLTDSVKIRMRSDVPFGAFLSGGLDSSSIVALMSAQSSFPVETFTIGFNDKAYDERDLAAAVARKYRTNHHEHVVIPDLFDNSLDSIVYHYDEPFGDSSAIPTGYVSRFAASKVKMVLTGDGGDEVLSGYTVYQGEKFTARYRSVPSLIRKPGLETVRVLSRLFRGSLRYKLNRVCDVCDAAELSFLDRVISKQSWASISTVKRLLGNTKVYPVKEFLEEKMKNCHYQDPFYRMMYFNSTVSLPDDMLVKVDRMSMAHSLETRTPFLDPRLIEFMTGVHKNIKMKGYERKTVLRNTIGKQLPLSLLHAPKKGFAVPLREWFKDGSFENRLDSILNGFDQRQRAVLQEVIRDNRIGARDYGNFIWMLFALQKVNADGQG